MLSDVTQRHRSRHRTPSTPNQWLHHHHDRHQSPPPHSQPVCMHYVFCPLRVFVSAVLLWPRWWSFGLAVCPCARRFFFLSFFSANVQGGLPVCPCPGGLSVCPCARRSLCLPVCKVVSLSASVQGGLSVCPCARWSLCLPVCKVVSLSASVQGGLSVCQCARWSLCLPMCKAVFLSAQYARWSLCLPMCKISDADTLKCSLLFSVV